MLITVSTHNVREQKTEQIVWAIVKSAKEELSEALLDKQFPTYIYIYRFVKFVLFNVVIVPLLLRFCTVV